ncbi:hypothetical protein ACJMK2_027629 [Sinanodonta woodiana]|uniref:Androglobin n=1 Tax=Sinanodonta woodiana TaxID=1069815 RepID=A0ABD3X550_SINWO
MCHKYNASFIRYRAASIAASAGGPDSKRPKLVIWPEWNDADVNGEKWDVAHKGKEKDKGKSPVAAHFFEDPEGKIEMAPSLKVDNWKRPQEFITEKTPQVVDPDGLSNFDLIKNNEHLHESELMRNIISQITSLWEMSAVKNPPPEQGADPSIPYEEYSHTWKPWEHIYAINKVQKGPHIPPFNPYGKYVVRLYWMGCWRKIIVDDQFPYDDNGQLLLPATTMQNEIWSMLLTKALIKVASLDYTGGSSSSEFGDFSVINCLTGWLPEAIPLQYGHISEIWDLLKNCLPEWKLPLQEWEKSPEPVDQMKKEETASADGTKDEKSEKDSVSKDGKAEKVEAKPAAGKDAGKDKAPKDAKDAKDKGGKDGKDKKEKGDKDKKQDKEKMSMDETPLPEHPEVVVFATYWSPPKYPAKISVMGDRADASERLRQNGLSHIYPHPVLITQTRSCPLEPPPPPEKIPAWKLIRPRKKKTTPSDEPVAEPEPPKPIQCLEITSPFVNYRVSPVPIPTDTHRPRSALERGGTRSRPHSQMAIEETDENAPEPEPENLVPKPKVKEETEQPQEHQQIPEVQAVKGDSGNKPSTPGKEKSGRRTSATRRESNTPQDLSTKADNKGAPKTPPNQQKGEQSKSAGSGRASGESKLVKKDEEKGKEKETKPQDPKNVPSPVHGMTGDQGGLAVPPVGEEPNVESAPVPLETHDDEPKSKKRWVDFTEFCKCFKTLYIFHKPSTYPCSVKHSDSKSVAPPVGLPQNKADKKSAPSVGVNPSPSRIGQNTFLLHSAQASSPATLATSGTSGVDDRAPHYLFVDNLQPTEIVVSFSSLSRWHETPPLPVEEKKSHTSIKGGKGDKGEEKELTTFTSSSVLEGSVGRDQAAPPVVNPGTLVAEPYSWKSLVTGQPILRIRTTALKAAVLCLPAGRHVLKFMMSAPLGYHVHLCSTVQFVFGDEETVMAQLTKESCRFVDNATQVMNSIGKCINSFHEAEAFKQAWDELVSCHCPYLHDKLMSKQHHFQVFNDALYACLRKVLRDIVNPDISFAWRAFNFDATSKNILGITTGSRPATGQTGRGSAKLAPAAPTKKQQKTDKSQTLIVPAVQPPTTDGEPEKVENTWANREPTTEMHVATVKLQKQWKGYWVRKIKIARTPGTEENLKVQQNLQKCWQVIEQNLDPTSPEHPGLYLFRHMFKTDMDLMEKFPFYQDEWNKISYADYQGQYPEQPNNTWFVVFREVFYVSEEMLAVPKLYVPINTCMLRVINNDTGEEIPRVFQKVAPYVYKKNRKGYTFVAEARSTEHPIYSNKWKMRIIGSLNPLPTPLRGEVNSSFHVRDIRDYYVPNSMKVIFRYTVKVSEDHLVSIQMNTSKSDVYIKLVVLDHDEELASTIGKGHAVIPAFFFLKDINPDDEQKRPGSKSSNKGGKNTAVSHKGKRTGSGKSQDGRGSRSSHHSDGALSDPEPDERDLRPHKYVIQAMVLKDSWPLSETSWAFVQMLKEMEKNELKVAFKEKPTEEAPKAEKTAIAADKAQKGGKGAKGGKEKGGKEKDSKAQGSRPSSQQFDHTRPHWTLRVVSDASTFEDIDVKRDTERADEIRAMKKAWEDAQPGRAANAMQSRLKYLSTHTIKLKDDEDAKDEGGDKADVESMEHPPSMTPGGSYPEKEDEGTLTLEPPQPPTPKEMLQPLDFSQFLRKTDDVVRYLDEFDEERRLQEEQQMFEEYKQFRQRVEQWRDQDKNLRNLVKQKQLEQCEELQAMLDAARLAVNTPREAFRQKYLEAERKRQEEIAAQEANVKTDTEVKSPKRGKSANKGKKSPAGGKKKK